MAWKEATDKANRKYYYNTETRETKWDKPEELYTDLEKRLVAGGWFWRYTKEGKLYYYNKESKESSWAVPAAFANISEASETKVKPTEGSLDETGDTNTEEAKSMFEGMLIMDGFTTKESSYEELLPELVTKSSFWLIKPASARRDLFYEISERPQGLEFAERIERMVKKFGQDLADGKEAANQLSEITGKNNLEYEFAYYKHKQIHTDTKSIEAAVKAEFEELKTQNSSESFVQCMQRVSQDQNVVLPSEWEAACRCLIEIAKSEVVAEAPKPELVINNNLIIAKARLAFTRALEQNFIEAKITVDTPWFRAQVDLLDDIKIFAEQVYDKCYQGPTPYQLFTAFLKSQQELIKQAAVQVQAKLAEHNQTIGSLESKDLDQYIDASSSIANHAQSVYQLLIDWSHHDRRAVRRKYVDRRAVELEY